MNRRDHLREVVQTTLEKRGALAFVHVGLVGTPTMAYCLSAVESPRGGDTVGANAGFDSSDPRDNTHAVAFTESTVLECGPSDDGRHPAEALAVRLGDCFPRASDGARASENAEGGEPTLLTPQTLPHDAACYLESAGFTLASSDLVERARTVKVEEERARIDRAQAAASAGIRDGGALLASATVSEFGVLEVENGVGRRADPASTDGRDRDQDQEFDRRPLTAGALRIAVDEAIVRAGAFPAGNTRVVVDGRLATGDERLRVGEPIGLSLTPREPGGYHGGLARTVVVEGEGGWERRANVALVHAFRSARALLSTDDPTPTIARVEADLDAEIRAFGFDAGIETSVHGIGLEPTERPVQAEDAPTGSVLRLEAAVVGPDGGRVSLADLLVRTADGAQWFERPPQALEVAALETAMLE